MKNQLTPLDSINDPADISEKAIIFRISKFFYPGLSNRDLHEVTRGRWILGARKEEAELAFSVNENVILEIYEIDQWHPAGSTPTTRKDAPPPERWEFTGVVAPEELREKYIGKTVAHYFNPGARNPVRYINI